MRILGLSGELEYGASVPPGSSITIQIPVTNKGGSMTKAFLTADVYEGSAVPRVTGTKIAEFSSYEYEFKPNERIILEVGPYVITGTDKTDRRDIRISVWASGKEVAYEIWEDAFYVNVDEVKFSIERPVVKITGK